MGLRFSYTLLAPVYDFIVASPTRTIRKSSWQRLSNIPAQKILINGIGTGLDIPYLPQQHIYTATDLTPAMLQRCESQPAKQSLQMELFTADVMQLPFNNDEFDIVMMHLILAVVPDPLKALQEAIRVLKPGGRIYILDKFLKPAESAPLRRLLNIFSRHIATRMDVVFEELLPQCPQIKVLQDEPALMRGWFRMIDLQKFS